MLSIATPHCLIAAMLALGASTGAVYTSADPRVSIAANSPAHHESLMTVHARGTFDVQIAPQPVDAYTDAATMGRMTIDKQFTGDIIATSKGQMLTGMGNTKGSAAYVAMERVTGTVHGKRGSFVLHHTGVMASGAQSLTITIAPDSGTDELTGISGSMTLVIEGKVHDYDLAYTLPGAP
jgi:Protein of unknown function (DUF3224)